MWPSTSAASSSTNLVNGIQVAPTLKRKSSTTATTIMPKRITLTSKRNWWLIDLEEEEPQPLPLPPPPPPPIDPSERIPSDVSPPQFHAPTHPSTLFSHPVTTPTALAAHHATSPPSSAFPPIPNPTSRLAPIATGSTSEIFKCVVKKPDIMQIEINGEMQTNAPDVMVQFLAELRVYATLRGHRNFAAYLGSLESVGMVLEYIEGKSLLDVLRASKANGGNGLQTTAKVDIWDQLLDGLTYLHSFGLSHGDLSLLNVLVTPTGTLKILDFGRSTSVHSKFVPPSDPPPEADVSVFAPRPQSPPPSYSQIHHTRPGLMSRNTTTTTQSLSFPADAHSITLSLNRLPSSSHLSSSPTTSPPTPRQKLEQIHPGTRPFCAPEILREECTDPILADAYSFGMIMLCVDLGVLVDIEPAKQRRGEVPSLQGCVVFREKLTQFLVDVGERKKLEKSDFMARQP